MPNACGLGMPGLCEHAKRKRTDVRAGHQPAAGDKSQEEAR